MYTDKLIEAFQSGNHVGEIENAEIIGKAGNPVCGDVMWIYMKLEDDSSKELRDRKVEAVKFKTMGCGAAIGTSEVICRLAEGKTLGEAESITKQDIIDYVGGLPPEKVHCSILATEAMENGIKEFENK